MTAGTVAGFVNGMMVGWLAGEAGFPWWGCAAFAGLSCAIMFVGAVFNSEHLTTKE